MFIKNAREKVYYVKKIKIFFLGKLYLEYRVTLYNLPKFVSSLLWYLMQNVVDKMTLNTN